MMNSSSQSTRNNQSSFVSVLAWIFIVLSSFAILVSLLQNILVNTTGLPTDHDGPWLQLFLAISLIVLIDILIAAIGLLKRKNWARVAFIILLGIIILFNIGGLVLQQIIFSSMFQETTPGDSIDSWSQLESISMMIRVFSAVIVIGLSVLFGWIIKRLLSPSIKQEFLSAAKD